MYMVSSLSNYIIGTKAEGLLTVVLLAFWSATVAAGALNRVLLLLVIFDAKQFEMNLSCWYIGYEALFSPPFLCFVCYSCECINWFGGGLNQGKHYREWQPLLFCK